MRSSVGGVATPAARRRFDSGTGIPRMRARARVNSQPIAGGGYADVSVSVVIVAIYFEFNHDGVSSKRRWSRPRIRGGGERGILASGRVTSTDLNRSRRVASCAGMLMIHDMSRVECDFSQFGRNVM